MDQAGGGQPGPVEVVELTESEYRAAKRRALGDLGTTYDDLARQAENRRFVSPRHRKLWLLLREY